jgi:hypothetical protein
LRSSSTLQTLPRLKEVVHFSNWRAFPSRNKSLAFCPPSQNSIVKSILFGILSLSEFSPALPSSLDQQVLLNTQAFSQSSLTTLKVSFQLPDPSFLSLPTGQASQMFFTTRPTLEQQREEMTKKIAEEMRQLLEEATNQPGQISFETRQTPLEKMSQRINEEVKQLPKEPDEGQDQAEEPKSDRAQTDPGQVEPQNPVSSQPAGANQLNPVFFLKTDVYRPLGCEPINQDKKPKDARDDGARSTNGVSRSTAIRPLGPNIGVGDMGPKHASTDADAAASIKFQPLGNQVTAGSKSQPKGQKGKAGRLNPLDFLAGNIPSFTGKLLLFNLILNPVSSLMPEGTRPRANIPGASDATSGWEEMTSNERASIHGERANISRPAANIFGPTAIISECATDVNESLSDDCACVIPCLCNSYFRLLTDGATVQQSYQTLPLTKLRIKL